MMEENVTLNFNVSTDESENDVLIKAMSYTMYKIGKMLVFIWSTNFISGSIFNCLALNVNEHV